MWRFSALVLWTPVVPTSNEVVHQTKLLSSKALVQWSEDKIKADPFFKRSRAAMLPIREHVFQTQGEHSSSGRRTR